MQNTISQGNSIQIVAADGIVYAVCGDIKVRMNIDPETNSIIGPTGVYNMFRRVVDIEYKTGYDELTGESIIQPEVTMYANPLEYITAILETRYASRLEAFKAQIVRYKAQNKAEGINGLTAQQKQLLEVQLASILSLVYTEFYTPEDPENPETSFGELCQNNTIMLSKNQPPRIKGTSWVDRIVHQRVTFAEFCEYMELSKREFTQVGNPGTTLDGVDKNGYPLYAKVNPLLTIRNTDGEVECIMPQGRWGVARGVSHAVPLKNVPEPIIKIEGLNVYPDSTPLKIVCLEDCGFEDSIIISESAAEKLTSARRSIKKVDIHGLINERAGVRYTGQYIKEDHDPWLKSVIELLAPCAEKETDADVIRELRAEFEKKNKTAIRAAGSGSTRVTAKCRSYILNSKRWQDHIAAKKNRPTVDKFPHVGLERITLHRLTGDSILYKLVGDKEYKPLEIGGKIAAYGDLFKGIVAQILPDDAMPKYQLADGTMQTAEVVCEMSESTKKHGSLLIAHLQLALYQLAAAKGEITVDHTNPLSVEQIVDMCTKSGVYEDDNLCCEVYSSDGFSMGYYPCGVMPVVRYPQDPDVVGGAVGKLRDRHEDLHNKLDCKRKRYSILLESWKRSAGKERKQLRRKLERTKVAITKLRLRIERGETHAVQILPDKMKAQGVRSGYIDSAVRRSMGFAACDEELRRVPRDAESALETLRQCAK